MSRATVRRIRKLIRSHATQARAYLAAVAALDREASKYADQGPRDHLATLARIHAVTCANLGRVLNPGLRD
jgi:hypothetical protein